MLELRGSNREIKYDEDSEHDMIEICQAKLQTSVGGKTSLITDVSSHHNSTLTGEKADLLQCYSTKWQQFVDVVDIDDKDDKDHLKAVPSLHKVKVPFC